LGGKERERERERETVASRSELCVWIRAETLRKLIPDQHYQDGRHKATPTPEPGLKKCSMYSRNSCCSVTDVQDLFVPENSRWDKCGVLSPL
ncbi:hypothetical protein DNTS_022107, partial [Danionella cerebrum]